MSQSLHILDMWLRRAGESVEGAFKRARKSGAPQYRYLSGPIYKFVVGKVGSVAAVGISVLVTDLIAHHILPQAVLCGSSYPLRMLLENSWQEFLELEDWCEFHYNQWVGLTWGMMAAFVMYAKHRRNQET